MAYVGEHFAPVMPQGDEEVWGKAVHHVLGGRESADLTPEQAETVMSAFAEIYGTALAVSMSDNQDDLEAYSPESMARTALGLVLQRLGTPRDLPEGERLEVALQVVGMWLVNVRDGAMDATHAFLNLEREDDE